MENQNAVQVPPASKKSAIASRIGTVVAVAVGASASLGAYADIDVSTGVTAIGGAVAAIAAVGAAKMIPQATITAWGYIKNVLMSK